LVLEPTTQAPSQQGGARRPSGTFVVNRDKLAKSVAATVELIHR